jgi:hypothetical protein
LDTLKFGEGVFRDFFDVDGGGTLDTLPSPPTVVITTAFSSFNAPAEVIEASSFIDGVCVMLIEICDVGRVFFAFAVLPIIILSIVAEAEIVFVVHSVHGRFLTWFGGRLLLFFLRRCSTSARRLC